MPGGTAGRTRRGAGADGKQPMANENTKKSAHTGVSQRSGEFLSAVMDGEADDLALRRLIQESAADPAMQEKWERYHLAQDVVRGRGRPVSSGFSRRVAAAIDVETALEGSKVVSDRLSQQLLKFAIAAAVAMVAVVTLQPEPNELEISDTRLSAIYAGQPPGAERRVQSLVVGSEPAIAPVPVDPEAQQRLRDYIESMSFDSDEALRSEHIQESPLYRLVNQLQTDNR